MEIYIDADVDLINGLGVAYLLIGLFWSLIVLRVCARNEDDYAFINQKLGIVIITSVIGWPYNLFCWIFSWSGWLMPAKDVLWGESTPTFMVVVVYPLIASVIIAFLVGAL